MIILQRGKIYYHQICSILRHKEDDFTNQIKAGERKVEEDLKSKKRNSQISTRVTSNSKETPKRADLEEPLP